MKAVPQAVMYVYPWALNDMGPKDAFNVMESCGIDAIQLALSYHIGTYLSPRNPKRRVYYGDQGALYFSPRASRHIDWPFPPPISDLAREPTYMPNLVAAAANKGLRAIAWVIYLYNHALARSHPDLAVHNVFGDHNEAQLCPANPVVQRYAHALTRAVANLEGFEAFHAESLGYLPYDYGFLNFKSAVTPGPQAKRLLSLCFCLYCQTAARGAGIQIELLKHGLQQWIDNYLNQLPDGTCRDQGDNDGPPDPLWDELHAFMDVRAKQVLSLHDEVLTLASDAGLRVSSNIVEPDGLGLNGYAAEVLRTRMDELRVRIQPNMKAGDLEHALAIARRNTRVDIPTFGFYNLGIFNSETTFMRAVELAQEQGIRHHRFYEFSLLTQRQLEWISAARQRWSSGGFGFLN